MIRSLIIGLQYKTRTLCIFMINTNLTTRSIHPLGQRASITKLKYLLDQFVFDLGGAKNSRKMSNFEQLVVKKVLVLYVGGTIGMQKNFENVYAPAPNRLCKFLQTNPLMHSSELANKYIRNLNENQLIRAGVENSTIFYEVNEYETLLDSSNMSSKDWIKIASDIEEYYRFYDGFVILHGTDTLAYTASALSFMLDGLKKPVILTGSQIPIYEENSDGLKNFYNSVTFAACFQIPEVCIFFANKLLRGNRTTKISSTELNAFNSLNYPILAIVKQKKIKVFRKHIRAIDETAKFTVMKNLNQNVNLLHFFPTITSEIIDCLLQSPIQGLVLQSYGLGNISNHADLLEVLRNGIANGILVVNITQCTQGTVHSSYETGKALEDVGIISGHDMTVEAALTKLCFVLNLPGLSHTDRVRLIKEDLRGELTLNEDDAQTT